MKRNGNGKPGKRLAIVDDDPMVLDSLATGLGETFDIVAKCTSGEDALQTLPALPPDRFPHLVLLDIKMPGMGGVACCSELRKGFPKLVIAMHTAKAVGEFFDEARTAGADAYFVKTVEMTALSLALQRLHRREYMCVCLAPASAIADTDAGVPLTQFSEKEEEILRLLADGLAVKEIAHTLARHEQTVKWNLAKVRRKLGAVSNVQAVRIWFEQH